MKPEPGKYLRCALLLFAAWLSFVMPSSRAVAEPPRLVVSIPPLHSLAAGVMQGIAPVDLLLPAGHSPHDSGLAPSRLRALTSADLVLWTGPGLETGIARAVKQVPADRVITLMAAPEIHRLRQRAAGIDDDHGEAADESGHAHHHGEMDPHIWLSTRNASAIVDLLVERLAVLDPGNASSYRDNGRSLRQRIEVVHEEIDVALAPVRDVPYLVFHDAYQYFETEFSLGSAGSVTLNPGRAPGAKHLKELRNLLRQRGIRCLFAEPQFEPRVLSVLVEDSDVRTGMLDPLGVGLATGPTHWFELMQGLQTNLLDCLAGPSA